MKQKVVALMAGMSLLLPLAWLYAAEKPKELKKALCPVCSVRDGETEHEEVNATAEHKGKTYEFCSVTCKTAFVNNPEAYIPPVFPRPLPSFTVKTLSGKEVASKALTGKPMLIDFWATWSKPTVSAMPELQKLHQRHAAQGFSVVGISVEEGPEAGAKTRQFVAQQKIQFPVYLGATQSPPKAAFHLTLIPALYLVNSKGQIVQQWTGNKVDLKEVEQAVAKLVSSKG